MIVIISSNKYANRKISDKVLEKGRLFFMFHEDKWYKANELKELLEYSNPRVIVNRLRNEGMPIISDINKGYCYTYNKDLIKKSYEELREKLLVGLTAAKNLKKYL